jgi:hypothetical protein
MNTAPTTQAEQEDAVRERYTVVYEGDSTGVKILSGEPAAGRAVIVMAGDLWEEARTLRAERDQLAADLRKAAVQISDLAQAKGEAEGRLLASEMAGVVEGWRERALKAEAEKDRLHDAMEDLQGAFHESSDTYAKITAALTPDPKDAGGTAKGDDPHPDTLTKAGGPSDA